MTSDGATDLIDDLIGTVVHQRYRVDAKIGAGGVATVFRAMHLMLERPVVLKVLHPGHDILQAQMFVREATLMTRLEHRNIMWVFDQGQTDCGLYYMAMQFLDGHTLVEETGTPMDEVRAAKLIADALRGLVYAHSKGVVHRDLKPDNLFVTTDEDGRELLKILDFGIAKVLDPTRADDGSAVTLSGLLAGTPMYMAPEQIIGSEIDERADLYAVGVILYELLCGAPPWDCEDAFGLLKLQLHEEIPALPPSFGALGGIVQRLCAKDRAQRYASAELALADLEAHLHGPAPALPEPTRAGTVSAERTPARTFAVVGGLLAVIVGATSIALASSSPAPTAVAQTAVRAAGLVADANHEAPPTPEPVAASSRPADRVTAPAVPTMSSTPPPPSTPLPKPTRKKSASRRARDSDAGTPTATEPPAATTASVSAPSEPAPGPPSSSMLRPDADADAPLLQSRERSRPTEQLMPSH